jgi:EmrB/QacA subfamily drug resistance transporter
VPTETETRVPGLGHDVRQRWAILAVLCVSLLVVSLDNTILNIALPALVRSLHATESELQWIVDVYALSFAGCMLTAGSIGDRVGRKKVFAVGLAVFAAGSAGSAMSSSVVQLITWRCIMGAGAACIMPTTLSIITDVFRQSDDQARAIGIWSGTTGLGIAIGPIAGGWLLAHFWWGSVFLVNVPIALTGLLVSLWVVPDSWDPAHRHLDIQGAVLSAGGVAALVWAIIQAPTRGWSSPMVLGVGGLALVLLGLFAGWEHRSSHPMLVLPAFSDRRFSMAMSCVALGVFALMAALFVLTQYLQFSLGYSALSAGERILPIAGVLAVAAVSSTYLARLAGTKIVVALGMAVIATGLWRLTTTSLGDHFAHALGPMLLLGAGAGLVIAPATASVMGSLPTTRAAVGAATNGTSLQIGGALGVAVVGSVLTSRYQSTVGAALAGHAVPAAARSAIEGSLGGALTVAHAVGGSTGAALATLSRRAFVDGMDLSLTVAAVVVGAGAALALLALPARRSNRTLDTVGTRQTERKATAGTNGSQHGAMTQ